MWNGKKIMVVGATGNIGKEIVCFLIKHDATPILVGRNEKKLQEVTKKHIGSPYFLMSDTVDSANVENIFCELREKNIKLDGLVYCVGICSHGLVKTTTENSIIETFRVNTLAFYLFSKYCSMPKYSNKNCSIVAISSIAAKTNEAGLSLYSMTKSAMNSLVQSMSKEFLKRQIRVNAVMPAEVMSKMNTEMNEWSNLEIENIKAYQPLGPIPIDQVVQCIAFLLSENASYITGECITISGGYQNKTI